MLPELEFQFPVDATSGSTTQILLWYLGVTPALKPPRPAHEHPTQHWCQANESQQLCSFGQLSNCRGTSGGRQGSPPCSHPSDWLGRGSLIFSTCISATPSASSTPGPCFDLSVPQLSQLPRFSMCSPAGNLCDFSLLTFPPSRCLRTFPTPSCIYLPWHRFVLCFHTAQAWLLPPRGSGACCGAAGREAAPGDGWMLQQRATSPGSGSSECQSKPALPGRARALLPVDFVRF